MYTIIKKESLGNQVIRMVIHAPFVARKALAGQFVIVRSHEDSERLPLTIADYNRETGCVDIIFQVVGKGTQALNQLEQGQSLQDIVGPLGRASHTKGIKKAVVVGGGVGCAIALPILKALYQEGAETYSVIGFRNKSMVILEEAFAQSSKNMVLMTDDGSYGRKGMVTEGLEGILKAHSDIDCVYVIGPLVMMKYVSQLTKQYDVTTIVSMNPIMVDGTGMCGGCRLTVGGKTQFACIDGPEFDGHLVDFDEVMMRNKLYDDMEEMTTDHKADQPAHKEDREAHCRLYKQEVRYV